LKRACGVAPTPLFDTQIAAGLAGIGAGMGYQKIVQEMLGVALEKGEQRSDWLRRPLTDSQLHYAAQDVVHLDALYRALSDKLDALGRRAWLDEDSARLAQGADENGDRWPHLALRAAQFLDTDGQHRLLRLLRWRDAYARSSDRPRNWILDNELATALARTPPIDRDGLKRQLDAIPKSPRSLLDPIWNALTTPLPDEAESPAPRTEDRDKATLRKLQDTTAEVARELGLPDGVLASRRWLETLLDGHDWPGALSGCCQRIDLELPRLRGFRSENDVQANQTIAARHEQRHAVSGDVLLHSRIQLIGSNAEIIDREKFIVDVETRFVSGSPAPDLRYDEATAVDLRDGTKRGLSWRLSHFWFSGLESKTEGVQRFGVLELACSFQHR
jgi:ribonuclease D